MPHCTSDMRDQDDEINHEGISRRDKWWWAFTWGGFFVGTKSRLQEAAFAFRGEDSPQGNPRCRKQLSHLPTLAWRGSPRGRFSPGNMQEAAFAFADPCLERISPGEDSPQGNPRCRKPFAFAGPCLGRILPRANIAIGPSILCSSRICTPYRLAASRLLPTAIVDCLWRA